MTDFRLGLVEGFYGRPWSWQERADTASFLSGNGYGFYLYAPKADPFLRRRWREPSPVETRENLSALVAEYRHHKVRFGVGLSPHELHRDSSAERETLLLTKVEEVARLGIDHLALLFDDMKGDLPGLASAQIAAAHAIQGRFPDLALSLCPTYYSYDPLLERLFGPQPKGYLEELGEQLDPAIELFWTGERICSKEYPETHLEAVAARLRRKPLLWDNYPVNDTEKMSPFLHLDAVTGRPASLKALLSGHLVNPMLQCTLSRIAALTLAASYTLGSHYNPLEAFSTAARNIAGSELAALLSRDLRLFQDKGLNGINTTTKGALLRDYGAFDHPAAREVVDWLQGEYAVTREKVVEQC